MKFFETVTRRAGESADSRNGRLTARAGKPAALEPELGLQAIGRESGALLYVPRDYRHDDPRALVMTLHGAGGTARHALDLFLPLADEARLLVLAPQSLGSTWDVILGGYGPDVASIDDALEQTFARYAVDPRRIAIGGFSDGASYALSLGLTNGDLFSAVLAFSPGFAAAGERRGSPAVFISHGADDRVLPIDVTSRRVVPRLRTAGYDVRYHEFDGPHTVPPEIVRAAVAWFLAAERERVGRAVREAARRDARRIDGVAREGPGEGTVDERDVRAVAAEDHVPRRPARVRREQDEPGRVGQRQQGVQATSPRHPPRGA